MEFGRQQSSSSRMTGLGFVVLLHVVLIYGLIYGLSHNKISIMPQPIETKIIKEVKPPPPPPPPPSVTIPPPPPVYIPPPEVNITQAAPSTTAIAAVTTTKAPPAAPPPVAAPVQHVVVPADISIGKNCPIPDYPAASQRLGESGVTVVEISIDAAGKISGTKIITSSGYPRLDEATIAGFSRCKLKPGTIDGQPQPTVKRVAYKWVNPD